MTTDRPKILITNDDGIQAKGLWHLWHALADKADVTIVAPSVQRSGASLALTLHKPLTIHPAPWTNSIPAWKINGTPADCVRFGLRVLMEQKPDIILSGINHGSNAGRNVLYSGTIGGVVEGMLRGIPGIAFSSTDFENPRFELAEPYIWPIVQHILEHPLSLGTILNINFPSNFEKFKGMKLARQGKGLWVEDPDRRIHPDGQPYFWQGGKWAHHEEPEESDVALLEEGYITAVPIHVEELTDHSFIKERKDHFESHFSKGSLFETLDH